MLVLASASPRRLELLRLAGIDPLVDVADVVEDVVPGAAPAENAVRLACAKASVVAARHAEGVVLGADTIVTIDGELLGKPHDAAEARAMLERLSGRGHRVVTGVRLIYPASSACPAVSLSVSTGVVFRRLTARDIDEYLAGREWQGKAGAYAIQGRAASFANAVVGSYTNVVGLPLAEVLEELRAAGVVP